MPTRHRRPVFPYFWYSTLEVMRDATDSHARVPEKLVAVCWCANCLRNCLLVVFLKKTDNSLVLYEPHMKKSTVTKNKLGQAIGQKGSATRRRLMEATRSLLKTISPMELTAVAIAQQAKTSSATLYMYFDDIKDIMYALSEEAGGEMTEVYAILEEPWNPSVVEIEHAQRLVAAFDAVWDRHREILRYRNLEADRGDPRFEELRVNYYMPVVERIARLILAASPPGKIFRKGEAYAEASVLYGALECIAVTDPKVTERGLGIKRLQDARARIIAHVLGNRWDGDPRSPDAHDQPVVQASKPKQATRVRKPLSKAS